MKVYISHSKNFDFQNELYKPLKDAGLPVEFIFPHEEGAAPYTSKELFQNHKVDYVLAEVSYPATDQGIELGWADIYKIPIICIYKKGTKPAGSLRVISGDIYEYDNLIDLINKFAQQFGLNLA